MNRRDFLQRSSAAAIVATALPLAIRHQQSNPSRYKTELKYGIAGQSYYELGIYHDAIKSFATAGDEQKAIGLKVNYYETADFKTPAKTGEYKYIIQSSELTDQSQGIWKIKTKLDKKIAGNHKFSREFPKHLTFICKPYAYVNILGKKDAVLVNIPYPPTTSSSSGSDDCFLTTACVSHKGLADDCDELITLRYLRDEFMKYSQAGQQLIHQYKQAGPAIVRAIHSCANKAEIYEYIHEQMILPSAMLVKQGKYEEAVEYYKVFTTALKEKYC